MSQNIVFVPLKKIVKNKFQQDVHDREKVLEIAESLIENFDNGMKGLLQVPPARRLTDGAYELAFGHHRFYAFEYLAEHNKDFAEMPVSVQDLTDLQMFRYLGIENLKRRDISPIEKGRMFRLFMDTFKKNSVETAKEFSTTDEDVRGAIRFLKLPEETQIMMQEGKIGVGSARELLALGKVAGPDAVLEVTTEIIKGTWDSPSDAIESALQQSDAVYLSAGNGWFAPKVFPVKHLKALTMNDLEEVLIFDEDVRSKQSITLMQEILTLIASGMEIVDEAFPLVHYGTLEALRVLVNPPKCDGCPFHAVVKSDHYCGLPKCNERKIEAWKQHEIEQTARKIGVPMYAKATDGVYFALTPGEPADRKLWKDGSPDLRLMKAGGVWNNFEGLNHELRAVVVGKEAEKRQKKAERNHESAQAENTADAREAAKYKREAEIHEIKKHHVVKFRWEVVSYAFVSALDGLSSLPFLNELVDNFGNNMRADFPDEVDDSDLLEDIKKLKKSDALKELRRFVMHSMLDIQFYANFNLSGGEKKPLIKHAQDMQTLAETWEVKLPKDFMKQAEAYQAELDKAIKEL